MTQIFRKNPTLSATARIEAFSDGVFAIAITLLILEIKVPTSTELQLGLRQALLQKWPSYLSFFIGFFTVLVCWINHHYLFNKIEEASHTLILSNSLTLFAVSFVPFPTAILAQSFVTGNVRTAVQLFGLTFILMSICYRMLSAFVHKNTDRDADAPATTDKKAIKRMYELAIVHTTGTIFLTTFNVFLSLILYVALFSMFLFPNWYTQMIMRWQNRKNVTVG